MRCMRGAGVKACARSRRGMHWQQACCVAAHTLLPQAGWLALAFSAEWPAARPHRSKDASAADSTSRSPRLVVSLS